MYIFARSRLSLSPIHRRICQEKRSTSSGLRFVSCGMVGRLSRRTRILGAAAAAVGVDILSTLHVQPPECRALRMQAENDNKCSENSSDIHLHVCTCTRAHSMCRVYALCTMHACMRLQAISRTIWVVVINSEDTLQTAWLPRRLCSRRVLVTFAIDASNRDSIYRIGLGLG
jgi:hypothetical protein